MAEQSRIEWTDATWNPVTGCTLVSEGCRNCYAAELAAGRLHNHPSRQGLARRNAHGVAAFTGEVRLNTEWLDQPTRWRKPRRIFVCAHGDLFHEAVPDDWILMLFEEMRNAHWHTFQVLTKRPERMRDLLHRMGEGRIFPLWLAPWPLPNVWLGVSAEDQTTADARIPPLLDTPAAVRFLSAEPLLGPMDLRRICRPGSDCLADALGGYIPLHSTGHEPARLDWVIVGGESGRHARPMHPDWARSLRDQCQIAGVPFFFKQWGEWRSVDGPRGPYAGDLRDNDRFIDPDGSLHPVIGRSLTQRTPYRDYIVRRMGKVGAGRLLDGREWSEMPDIATTIERMRA